MSSLLNRLKNSLIPEGSVRDRAIKSGIWVSGIRISGRVLAMVKVAILARLLAPAEFGLIALALLTLSLFDQFSKLGLGAALIQQEEEDVDEYLPTTWLLKIARGALIATLVFALAPLVAGFFDNQRLVTIIRVMALIPLFRSLESPGLVYFQKKLNYHKQFLYDFTGNVTNFIVTVAVALIISPTVWALIAGHLVEGFLKVIFSYFLTPFRPRLQFDLSRARELINYGKWITASGILSYLINEGDDAFIGRVLGAGPLGLYQLAFRFGQAPATDIAQLVAQVAFPAYSKVQQNTAALRTAFLNTLRVITFIAFPAALGIGVIAPVFVPVVLGDQWIPMILAMQILALSGAVRTLPSVYGPLFNALGQPDYNTKLGAVRLATIVIFIYPAVILFDIAGGALVILGSHAVPSIIGSVIAIRSAEATPFQLLRPVSIPFAASVLMAGSVELLRRSAQMSATFATLLFLIITGAVTYFVVILGFEYVTEYEIRDTLKMMVNTVRN